MRVVLLNQFYPPDVAPTGLYLHDLARALVARGHEVVCVASRHAYSGGAEYPTAQTLDGVAVKRLRGFGFGRSHHLGKLADYASYYARLATLAAQVGSPDLVVSLTTPPFLGLLGKLMADRAGARHAHWVMDLYPDVMQVHGLVDGFLLTALRALARASYAGSSAIVTLGPAMAARLGSYATADTRVGWTPLWAPSNLSPWPEDSAPPLRRERGWPSDARVLMYSGNLGLGHRFQEFLDAARQLGPGGPRWVFAGTGRALPLLERFTADHPQLPIELLAYVEGARLREHLCSADVHLISMDSRWEGTLLPSKLQASFAVGKPVIFVGGRSQDLARWILESDGGWVVEEGDVSGLLRAVTEANDPAELRRRGRSGHAFAASHFDRAQNLDALLSLLGV